MKYVRHLVLGSMLEDKDPCVHGGSAWFAYWGRGIVDRLDGANRSDLICLLLHAVRQSGLDFGARMQRAEHHD